MILKRTSDRRHQSNGAICTRNTSFRHKRDGNIRETCRRTEEGDISAHPLFRQDRKRPLSSPEVNGKIASLRGAKYPGFEGRFSTSAPTFPYLNLAISWSNEPGPIKEYDTCHQNFHRAPSYPLLLVSNTLAVSRLRMNGYRRLIILGDLRQV